MAAAGTGAVDGWEAWAVKPGKYLRSLRQLLLERAAKGTADESGESAAAGWNSQRRYEWLNEARGHAEAGTPVELLVRDLFVRWGANSDGGPSVYQRIGADPRQPRPDYVAQLPRSFHRQRCPLRPPATE